jgi:hypothetical protein
MDVCTPVQVQSIARALIDRLQVVVSQLQDPTFSIPPWRTGSDKVGLGTRAIKLSSNRVTGWVSGSYQMERAYIQR